MTTTFAPAKKPSISNSSKSLMGRLLTAKFSDGYDQTAPDGLNYVLRKYTLTWPALNATDADYIENFWATTGGAGAFAFLYMAPMEAVTRKWKSPTFARAPVTGTLFSIVIEMEECFNIV